MLRFQLFCHGNLGIAERGQIKRFPDAVIHQHFPGQKLLRRQISHNPALIHEYNPIHPAPEHVLQAVLNDDHRRARALLYAVYQFYGRPSRRRIQVGQGLIKEKRLHLLHHNAGQTDPLFLSAGKFVGRVFQMVVNIHQPGHLLHCLLHFLLGHTVIFQCKGNVLSHRQTDKLSVRVLQDRSHNLTQVKDTLPGRVFSSHKKLSRTLSRISIGNQTVDTAPDGAFTAAGSARNQHFLPRINIQIDMIEGRAGLGQILKSVILKRNDGLRHVVSPYRDSFYSCRHGACLVGLPSLLICISRLEMLRISHSRCSP